jgi:hypothetical protein
MSDPRRLSRIYDDDTDEALTPLTRAIVEGKHVAVKSRRREPDRDAPCDLSTRVARLEQGTRKKVSKREMEEFSDAMSGAISNVLNEIVAEIIEPMQKQILELEKTRSASCEWRGTWHDGLQCEVGSLATHKGSLWLAVAPTRESDRPGESSCWKLILKNGSYSDNGTRRLPTGTRT